MQVYLELCHTTATEELWILQVTWFIKNKAEYLPFHFEASNEGHTQILES